MNQKLMEQVMADSKWWQPIDEILPVHKQRRRRADAELHKAIDRLEVDNERLREALKYYADRQHPYCWDNPQFGDTARKALANLK